MPAWINVESVDEQLVSKQPPPMPIQVDDASS